MEAAVRTIPRQCTARSKRSGERCRRIASIGREVCANHGGKSPIGGVGHHAWRTGKYSRFMPSRLRARYEEALDDGTLLDLANEIALVDARLMAVLEQIAEAEAAGKGTARRGSEMRALIGERRRLVEGVRKIKVSEYQSISVHQAMNLLSSLVEAVRVAVPDPRALKYVKQEFSRLVGLGAERSLNVAVREAREASDSLESEALEVDERA